MTPSRPGVLMWYFADLVAAIILIIIACVNAHRLYDRTSRLFSPRSPDLIAPVIIAGKEIKDDRLGHKLAGLLEARMHKLGRDLKNSVVVFNFSSLRPTVREGSDELFGVPFSKAVAPALLADISGKLNGVSLPIKVFTPPAVSAEFKGVNFGAMVGWIHEQLYSHRILRITIQAGSEERWIVSGNLGSDAETQIVIEVDAKSESDVLAKVAFFIWRRELEKVDQHVAALNDKEFEELAQLVTSYAEHQQRETHGRYDLDGWRVLAKKAESIAGRVPSWPEMHLLAGSSFVRALDFDKARSHYEKAAQLIQVNQKTELTSDQLESIKTIIQTITTLNLSDYVDKRILEAESRLREILRVSEPPDGVQRRAKVAIVGGLPPAAHFQLTNVKRVGQAFSSDLDFDKDDLHTGNVARMTQLVAGESVEIIVAAMNGGEALVSNIRALREAKPDILAIAYSSGEANTFPKEVMSELELALAEGIIVIVPIGGNDLNARIMNLPVLSEESGKFMIVSGVDDQGRQAEFSKAAPGVFWLPGTGIPEINKKGIVVYGRGVSYSVGLAAGVVGRLKGQFPDASSKELLRALQTTASPVDPGVPDAKPVVNVRETQAVLAKEKKGKQKR